MPQPEILQTRVEAGRVLGISQAERSLALPLVLLMAGFLLRLGNAALRFLNADEALHYLLSVQPTLAAAYKASLTTVHPPLLIIFLHYWGMLGQSEFFLRLPSVFASILFCWLMFQWLKRVTNDEAALIGLAFFLFSPSLIQISSEIRQYALLWLFCAASLYFLERAFESDSALMVLCSGVALYLALLTHYSALIFALTVGVYGLLKFARGRTRSSILFPWVLVQACGLAVCVFLFKTHISRIRSNGETESVIGTYLSRSVLQPREHILTFIFRSNIRLFHYFFSQEVIGSVALVLFVVGIVWLARRGGKPNLDQRASSRLLAFLLGFPLVVNCILGLVRIYPYGGTRHNSYLAIFAFPAIAIALARWRPPKSWWKPAALAAILAACNLFPTPLGEFLRLRNQERKLMAEAVETLRSSPAGSTIFTDDQGGLLLSYYMCGSKVIQIEEPVFQPFMRARCGDRWVISLDPDWWIFKTATFPGTMREVQQTYSLRPGTPLMLFQAGWFIDKQMELHKEYQGYGCREPKNFGQNIFICEIRVPGP